MSDLISRKEAIATIHKEFDKVENIDGDGWEIANDIEECLRYVRTVDRVVSNANVGKWIDEGFYSDWHPHHAYRCSVCGKHIIQAPYQIHEYKYCLNCGAKMEVIE